MAKYGILAVNRGMWGGMRSWCKKDGAVILFDTYDEASAEVDRYNERRGPINNFTEYFPKEYDGLEA